MQCKDRWYVVQTKYKQEKTVLDNLLNQKFNVFFPQFMEMKLIRGKPAQVLSAMFPSYLFVEFNLGRDRWRSIGGTRGVSQLVTATEDRVSPLPEGFVEQLMDSSNEAGYLTKTKAENTLVKYVAGDSVEIKNGIFTGTTGTCVEINESKITLLLSLLSDNRRVSLPLECIS